MRLRRTLLLLAAGLMLALAVPADAEASFRTFAHFRVGGFDFGFGFHGAPHRYAPDYYYRLGRPLAPAGFTCGSACFRSRDVYYHHPTCPAVLHHFRLHRFDPVGYWGPVHRGHYYRYDVRGRYDRHDHRYRDGGRRYERDRRYYERDRRRDGRGRGVYRYWDDPRWRDPYDDRGRYDRDRRRRGDDSDSDRHRRHRRRPY